MKEGCTIGAKLLPDNEGYMLFKNKDFRRRHLDDKVLLTSSSFAVEGIASWDSQGDSPDRYAGFSIGINSARLAACCSNVRSIEGALPYDCLVQRVVEECASLDEAIRCMETEVKRRAYVWGNIVVATPAEVAIIEVRDRLQVDRGSAWVARANHHLLFEESEFDDDLQTTQNRLQVAQEKVESATSVDDLVSLCRSHEPEKGQFSVCRHGPPYYTVYSYIIRVTGRQITWYVCQGNPCEGKFVEIPIEFGPSGGMSTETLSRYPSKYSSG